MAQDLSVRAATTKANLDKALESCNGEDNQYMENIEEKLNNFEAKISTASTLKPAQEKKLLNKIDGFLWRWPSPATLKTQIEDMKSTLASSSDKAIKDYIMPALDRWEAKLSAADADGLKTSKEKNLLTHIVGYLHDLSINLKGSGETAHMSKAVHVKKDGTLIFPDSIGNTSSWTA